MCALDSKRQVPFDHRLGLILGNFLRSDRLDLLYDESEQALFLNRRGKRLTRQGFWQIIKGYASRAGLGGEVTPQTLRHSFARRKLQNGVELSQLQHLLGHAIFPVQEYTSNLHQGEDNAKEITTC